MPLPKGLLKNARQTISPPLPEAPAPATLTTTPTVATAATPLTPPMTSPAPVADLPAHPVPPISLGSASPSTYAPTKSQAPARRPQQKKRVHYTIDADLIAWAEDAYHDYRRADGSRLRSASEYVAELLRAARSHHRAPTRS